MNNILTAREYDTRDYPDLKQSWYAPLELLQQYKSVKDVRHTVTSSSAGNWEGYILQKIGKRSCVIMFSQENNWPSSGYTVYTSTFPLFSFQGDASHDDICKAIYGRED